ncbi:hypothetical protein DXG03_003712 [Asterophora parasitica]|uniref:Cytochrome P450 n=1 Tax=Asterophora parasitica TaxID=117018 RepID=A0A9P7G9K1_9AGAR|nr:hypothetical protein DXG03_003712 [Asterophora parasitica]
MTLPGLHLLDDIYTNGPGLSIFGRDVPILPTLLAIFVASRVVKLLKGIREVNGLTGFRVPFQPYAPPSAFLPSAWWNITIDHIWGWRHTGRPTIFTSNIEVAKQFLAGSGDQKASSVTLGRSFGKSEDGNRVLEKWGNNLVTAADGDVWRKHRRIVGPAFNNKLYEMVWAETLNTYRQMETIEGWEGKDAVTVPAMDNITTKLALLVISRCGFGLPFDWAAPPVAPDGKMSVQEALRVLTKSHIVALLMPDWVRYLPLPGFSKIREAFKFFSGFMESQIAERTAEVRSGSERAEERMDAFTMIVRANEQEEGKLRLNDREVIGNVFIMLFAGHETTAHALAATIALLALHQDIQNDILKQITDVVGYERDPTFDDYPNLDKVLNAFYEALRLFQYNPRYFEDPTAFKPSRWASSEPGSESRSEFSDLSAFFGFSIGPRACIGRKFATTEAVAFLTMLLRDWHVEPALRGGKNGEVETEEEWRERVMGNPDVVLTLCVKDAPMRFTRRRP